MKQGNETLIFILVTLFCDTIFYKSNLKKEGLFSNVGWKYPIYNTKEYCGGRNKRQNTQDTHTYSR